MTTKPTPPSRRIIPTEVQTRRNINLSDRLADMAARLGDGNVSAGIRLAIIEADAKRKRNVSRASRAAQ